jgi:hypothetical protein
MDHRAYESMPDWYRESLAAKYQFLIDELASLRAKKLWNSAGGIDVIIFAVLSYFAIGNLWAPFLTASVTASIWHGREEQKRFLIAQQMLAIEAEWHEVRENVVSPVLTR